MNNPHTVIGNINCYNFSWKSAWQLLSILSGYNLGHWLIGKDSDAGRDWEQEEKGTTEDEMAGWHHWLDGHESEWTLGVGDGQGGLACYDSWGCKESDMTERLIWSDLIWPKKQWDWVTELDWWWGCRTWGLDEWQRRWRTGSEFKDTAALFTIAKTW